MLAMASATVHDNQSCLICEQICTASVTLECGHVLCQVCIDCALYTQKESGVYTCPECEDFLPILPEQEEKPILCTYCFHSPVPAVKTCLLCEASLCDDHLKVHSKSADHVLSSLTYHSGILKCPVHHKVMEYYCYQDAACICVYCVAEKHQRSLVEPLNEASKEELRNIVDKLSSERERTERQLHSLMKRKKEIFSEADQLTGKVTALFRDIRRQLDDLQKTILSEISRQEEEVSVSITNLVHQLETEKDDLSRKMFHIEELCNLDLPKTILEGSADDLQENGEEVDNKVQKDWGINEFLIALLLHHGLDKLVSKARKDFHVPEAADVSLDLNTAANNVVVSRDLKSASWSVISQRRKESPLRFQQYQVLSTREFLSGHHYWEVETSTSEYWMLGMTYPSTETKGHQSWIGNNNKSWCLCRWHNEYSVRHDSRDIQLLSAVTCNRFGIYLDYGAGQLSFYELCDPIRELHTFNATFTEPLHAGFWVTDNGWIKIRQ